MKNGKKPTRRQKDIIRDRGLDPASWLVVKDTPEIMEVLHRARGIIRKIRKIV